jgi:hypothetical protein
MFEITSDMKQHTEEFQKRNIPLQEKSAELPEFYLDDDSLEELKDFCQNLDPYQEMDLKTKLRLQEYGVTDFSNPFEITNKLLLLLENNLQFREGK